MAADGGDEGAVTDAAKTALFQEALAELEERRSTIFGAVLNFVLNLLPGGAMLSSGNDLRELLRDQRSWVSLLRDSKRRNILTPTEEVPHAPA